MLNSQGILTCQAPREARTSLRSTDLVAPPRAAGIVAVKAAYLWTHHEYQGLKPSLISVPEISSEHSFNDREYCGRPEVVELSPLFNVLGLLQQPGALYGLVWLKSMD